MTVLKKLAHGATAAALVDNLSKVILGKEDALRLSVAGLLARGHLLLEDVPGTGKTLLAKAIARSVSGEFRRVQFTPDLLPSDITGTSVYNDRDRTFEFRPGPIFANVFLGDELNRATPRTQSALLEAMEEQQVSADGETRILPSPFFVIATQNPVEQHGVYPLPEAQLDRFLMRISIGYPDLETETTIVQRQLTSLPLDKLEAVCTDDDLLAMQAEVRQVHVDETVLNYAAGLVRATRTHPELVLGASPRATLGLVVTAQAIAYLSGMTYTTPDHVKQAAPAVIAHRLTVRPQAMLSGMTPEGVVAEILSHTALPLSVA